MKKWLASLPVPLGLFCLLGLICSKFYPMFSFLENGVFRAAEAGGTRMDPHLVGGDHMQVFYLAWKLKESLLHQWSQIPIDLYTFAANGHVFTDLHIGLQFWLIAFSQMLFGDILGYNIMVLFAPFAIAFTGAYFCLSRVNPYRWVNALLAFSYALYPAHFTEAAGGHSIGILFSFLPWYWGAVLQHQFFPKTNWGANVASVLLFFLVLSEEHLGYHTMLFSGVLCGLWGVVILRSQPGSYLKIASAYLWRWKSLLLGLLASVGAGLLINKILYISSYGGSRVSRTLPEIQSFSHAFAEYFFQPHSSYNIGNILILLLPILVYTVYKLNAKRTSLVVPWASGFLFVFVAASILMAGIGKDPIQSLGLYELAFKYLPFFKMQRVPPKMLHTASIFLILCVGIFFHRLAKTETTTPTKHWLKRGVMLLTLLCTLFQARTFWMTNRTLSPIFENFRASEEMELAVFAQGKDGIPATGIVLSLPVSSDMTRDMTLHQYHAYSLKRRMVGGYHGVPPEYFLRTLAFLGIVNTSSPTASFFHAAQETGVTHVLVNKHTDEEKKRAQRMQTFGLPLVFQNAYYDVYDLTKVSQEKMASFPNLGWSLEDSGWGQKGRWMLQEYNGGPVAEITQGDAAKLKDFKVKSYVKIEADDKDADKLEVVFATHGNFPLYLIRRDGTVQELSLHDKSKNDTYSLLVEYPGKEFYLATKEVFDPLSKGILDGAYYGHFIIKLNPLKSFSQVE